MRTKQDSTANLMEVTHDSYTAQLMSSLFQQISLGHIQACMDQVSGDVDDDIYDLIEDIIADDFQYRKDKLLGRLLYTFENEKG